MCAIIIEVNVQNRVSYVKCSPDGELPGNEKYYPRTVSAAYLAI